MQQQLTIKEIAEAISYSPKTVYAWINQGLKSHANDANGVWVSIQAKKDAGSPVNPVMYTPDEIATILSIRFPGITVTDKGITLPTDNNELKSIPVGLGLQPRTQVEDRTSEDIAELTNTVKFLTESLTTVSKSLTTVTENVNLLSEYIITTKKIEDNQARILPTAELTDEEVRGMIHDVAFNHAVVKHTASDYGTNVKVEDKIHDIYDMMINELVRREDIEGCPKRGERMDWIMENGYIHKLYDVAKHFFT